MRFTTVAADPSGGHPIWHSAVLAVAAIGLFAAIKIREAWANRVARDARKNPLDTGRAAPLLLAGTSAGAAVMHAAVCPAHFHEAALFGSFFLGAALLQGTWAILIVTRPTREALAAGVIGNTLVLTVWLVSRTTGLPIGPEVWEPEAIHLADVLATTLEAAIVITGAALLLPHRRRRTAAISQRSS